MGLFRSKKKKSKEISLIGSPLVDLSAQVVVENDCSYLYVYPNNPSVANTVRCCWIKNHVTVADNYSPEADMKKGLQPKVPTNHCAFPNDLSFLDIETLELVWGKEGYTAFLFENNTLICAIPYWADQNFSGYSKFSCNEEFSGIPLTLGNEENEMFKKSKEAKAFWKQDFSLLWQDYQDSYLNELEEKYGKHINYYAIDGGHFPPKALVVFKKDNMKYVLTMGVGLFPQPKVDMHFDIPQDYAFFELGFCYSSHLTFDESTVFSQISSITSIPWVYNTFLAHRHTVDIQVDAAHLHGVLISDKSAQVAEFQKLTEDNINLLWIVPITEISYKRLTDDPSDYSEVETRIDNSDVIFKG